MTVRAAIGLGSNLGDRAAHLTAAVAALQQHVGPVVAVSSLYETAPVGDVPQGDYLNAVAVVDTALEPRELLDRLLAIERDRGRERRERWGPRTLDLDLLLSGDRAIDEPGLTVPHPGIATRRFVLEPLVEAWPDAVIPTLGRASALLPAVSDQSVRRWASRRYPVPVSSTSADPPRPPYWILDTGYRIPPTPASPTIPAVTSNLHVVDHPLVQHKLTLMRDRTTASADFRRLLREISALMGYEVTRDLPTTLTDIETPLAPMKSPVIAGLKPVVVSILRAGGGILDGVLDVLPSARVGHIGLYRDPETLEAVEYYFKMPDRIAERVVVLVDPMLATGHSAVAAVDRVKALGPRDVRFVCLLAAPEGIATLHAAHPDVPIWTAAVDSHLNDHGYIVPGLGDAGDRIFGTK